MSCWDREGHYDIADGIREWVWWAGQDCPNAEWMLSDYDTWEKNPHYTGKPGRHPEDPYWEHEQDFFFSDGTPVTEDPYEGLKRRGGRKA